MRLAEKVRVSPLTAARMSASRSRTSTGYRVRFYSARLSRVDLRVRLLSVKIALVTDIAGVLFPYPLDW